MHLSPSHSCARASHKSAPYSQRKVADFNIKESVITQGTVLELKCLAQLSSLSYGFIQISLAGGEEAVQTF